jgi:DNA-binding NarL/FixJ family response regulator
MLTLRAKYKDGRIYFKDVVSFSGEHEVFITFLAEDDEMLKVSLEENKELKTIIRKSRGILTTREMEILRLIQRGIKVKEIAEELEITHGTARNHLTLIYTKLKVRNQSEAVAKAIRIGLLDPISWEREA